MRSTVNDASQCAATGVGTRPSKSIFDSASQSVAPAEAQNILFIADTTEMRDAVRQPVVVWER
jgi:hypothetical protein